MNISNISTLKTLIGINLSDNSLDMLLDYLLRITENKVKNYCNIKDIPNELELTIIEMAANLYFMQYKAVYEAKLQKEQEEQAEQYSLTKSSDNRIIKKETIGDYSVEYESLPKTTGSSFVSAPSSGTLDNILNDFKSQLQRFRKIKL